MSESRSNPAPARLTGEALEAWYAQGPSTPMPPEPVFTISVNKAALWLTFYLTTLVLINMVVPVTAPILVAGLVVWLVLGRGYFWQRMLLVAVGTFVLGVWRIPYLIALVLIVGITATLLYSALLLMPSGGRRSQWPLQFSSLELGACVLTVAVMCAFMRVAWQPEWSNNKVWVPLLSTVAVFSLNVVFASLPVLLHKHKRNPLWNAASMFLVLGAMPVLEGGFLTGGSPPVVASLFVLHAVMGSAFWLIVFPLEAIGAFAEPERAVGAPTEASIE